jgi:hypothetical protein
MEPGKAPDLISAGVQTVVETSARLGLSWKLRLATVDEVVNGDLLKVNIDGDDGSITAISMIGSIVPRGRVYVISIPPAGNYVIGQVNAPSPRRIATLRRTSASGTFTAETQVDSITGELVANRTYQVVWIGRVQSSVADGYARGRIREDTNVGTARQTQQAPTTIAAGQGQQLMMRFEYTPSANESKTFVATITRQAGTGSLSSFAAADAPVYMYIDYVYG